MTVSADEPERSDDEVLAALESDMATVEISAFLHEWSLTSALRLRAFSMVLGGWLTAMKEEGYRKRVIEDTLPMMIERLWPHEATMTFMGGSTDEDDDE